MSEGRGEAVKRYLSRIADGGYARAPARRAAHAAHHRLPGPPPALVARPGLGGRRGAARRSDRPGVECLYTSMRMETAWLEAQQGFAFKAQPMTLCAYGVDCAGAIDLSSAAARASANVAREELACAWEEIADGGDEPPSWRIADRLRGDGVAGVLAPSFAHRFEAVDVNAVFWRRSAEPPHRVRVVDDDARLPKDDASRR